MAETQQFTFHTLPAGEAQNLAVGYQTEECFETLKNVALSSRKLLLQRFYQEVHGHSELDGQPFFNQGWETLLRLEAHDPNAVKDLLLAPGTGSWFTQVFAAMNPEESASPPKPIWADIGYFNNIVAGFACRAGLDFELNIPAHNGTAHIPQQGTVHMPNNESWGVLSVSYTGTTLGFGKDKHAQLALDPAQASDQWEPVLRLNTRKYDSEAFRDIYSGLGLSLLLDTADPYNNPRPHKIQPEELEAWQQMLDGAVELLTRVQPHAALQLSRGLSVIVPAPKRPLFEAYSSSDSTGIGSIRASLPNNPVEAAEMLVHEYCGHSALNSFFISAPLTEKDSRGATLYAPWRDDPRPSGGLLHGIYSFSRVIDFYKNLRLSTTDDLPLTHLAEFEQELWLRQVNSTAALLLREWYQQSPAVYADDKIRYGHYATYGSVGQPISVTGHYRVAPVEAIKDFLTAAREHISYAQAVQPEIDRLVSLAVVDHQALWAAYHRVPDPNMIEKSAAAYIAGESRLAVSPIFSTTASNPAACRLNARAILARQFLLDPIGFEQASNREKETHDRADRALIMGKYATAGALYAQELKQNPFSKEAFVGKVLCQTHGGKLHHSALRRPELVLALKRAVAQRSGDVPDDNRITNWLFRA